MTTIAPYLFAATARHQADAIKATDNFLTNQGISITLLVIGIGTAAFALFKMLPLWADESRRRAEAWDHMAKAHENLPTLHALTHERLAALTKALDDFVDEFRAGRRRG